jgi:thymidylate kinase
LSKILIFEGIATSGKSTVTNRLSETFQNQKTSLVEEEQTHVPIMNKRKDLCLDFFKDLIEKELAKKPSLILFDRLYLTQAFRVGAEVDKYYVIEKLLSTHNAITVFLKVDDESIGDRVAKAALHRDTSWGEYIKSKGSTDQEIAQYYINQQKNQLNLLKQSKLPHKIFNTTNHNYDRIIQEIHKFACSEFSWSGHEKLT